MKQQEKKTTCASKGHIWVSTSSPFIDRCARAGCHAMRQCRHGVWTEPATNQPTKPAPPTAQQADMWGQA